MSNNNDFPQPYNRPGLPSLAYRIGDYTSFRQYLLSRLSQHVSFSQEQGRPLAKLTIRTNDDSAIALLDAWAVVGDVLTFYQERIANEGFLRTATERLSVLELARAIGYELSPGVAASTFLTFVVEDTPGSPDIATVPQGTVIKSIPGAGEKSQTFETSSPIIARAEWNNLQPRPTKPQEITSTTQQIYLQGVNTQLQAGEQILLLDVEGQNIQSYLLTLATVESIPKSGYTRITTEQLLPNISKPKVFAFRKRAALFGNNASRWDTLPDTIKRANGGTIRGGIFRLMDSWQSRSGNLADINSLLPTIDIRCLVVNQRGYLFTGTPGGGIFRSTDNGNTWTAVNTGLNNLNIQTLYINELGHLFAGTSNGGVFQSKDEGENWVSISTGSVRVESQGGNNFETVITSLPNTVIRALVTYTAEPLTQLSGTISSGSTTVNGLGTVFSTELKVGDIIAAAGQTRVVDTITSDILLTVNKAFRNSLPLGTTYFKGGTYIFAGTDDGIYLSIDQGKNWELKGLLNRVVRALLIVNSTTVATGKITTIGTDVTGDKTKFKAELKKGDAIAASNQVRIVESITDDNKLTIDKAFDSDITTPVRFSIISPDNVDIYAGTDDGIFRSSDYGNNWTEFTQRDLPNKNVTALAGYALLTEGTPFVISSKTRIFAGTTGNGVFFLDENDNTWKSINQGLANQDVTSLATYLEPKTSHGILVTGTSGGVFLITNPTNQDSQWTQINQGLTNTSVTGLAAYTKDSEKFLFAGTLFAGFVEPDWPNFQLPTQQIDLDTLYLQILSDSWVVLVNGSEFQAFRVDSVTDVSRRDFILDNKLTRIVPTNFIDNPSRFGLRDTVVLGNSEALELAEEQLTVAVQQHKIFQQPIHDKQIWLSQFIPGLQPDKTLIVSGKRIRAQVNVGGFVRSLNWEPRNQGLGDGEVRTILTDVDGCLFAGTTTGVFRSKDNGKNWEPINSLKNQEVTSLIADTITGGTLVSRNTQIWIRTGSIFTPEELVIGSIITITIDGKPQSRTIYENTQNRIEINAAFIGDVPDGTAFSITILFAGTANGVFRSTDNGQTWIQVPGEIKNVQALAIHPESRHLFVGTREQGVFYFSNYGQNAVLIGLINENIQSLVVTSNNYIYVGTAKNGIFRSTNNGSSWQQLIPNMILSNVNITTLSAYNNYLFAGTAGVGVFRSSDHGENWEQINTNLTDTNIRCLAVNPSSGFIFVGTTNGVFRSHNLGKFWLPINAGLMPRQVWAIAIQESSQELFAGTRNGVFYSSNDGSNWQKTQWERSNQGLLHPQVQTLTVGQTDDHMYIFVGNDDGVFRSADNGEYWETVSDRLTNKTVQSLAFHNTNQVLFAGTADGIFRSKNWGKLWESVNTGLTHKNVQALVFNKNQLFGATKDGGIFVSNNWGDNWTFSGLLNIDVKVLAINSSNGYLFAGTRNRGIFRSINQGSSWQQLVTLELSSNNITALLAYTQAATNYLFAGTAGSGIFRSQDNGDTWQQVSGEQTKLLEIRCLAVNLATKGIFAGTARNGVFHSTNHGDDWEALPVGLTNTDIRAIAIHQSNILIGGVGILLSRDGFNSAGVKPDDLLWVTAPPSPFPETAADSQQWHLIDRNDFEGFVVTTTPQDITLQPAANDDPIYSEGCLIQTPPTDQQEPILTLQNPLQGSYDPATVVISANVVRATHGETVADEVLGSGDGTADNQSFILRKPPLTYTSAATTSGAETTLKVYVNDVRWQEVHSLYQLSDLEQSYIVRIEDDGTTTIIFGDGKNGARLPSGQENITATYRSGIGLEGNVSAGSLSLLKTRPVGIIEVTNPLTSSGGADKETLASARTKAPTTVRILDRIVSLRDFEDFARSFTGIGKAKAVALWDGENQRVHLTVAGIGGNKVQPNSSLHESLVTAIDDARDRLQRLQVDSYEPLWFNLEATVRFDARRYKSEKVMMDIRNTLRDKFAFVNRLFGQAVTASEVIAAIQNVQGVIAVDLDALYRREFSKILAESLSAELARWDGTTNQIQPAQLLLLNSQVITLTEF